jgi:hypothetical protein
MLSGATRRVVSQHVRAAFRKGRPSSTCPSININIHIIVQYIVYTCMHTQHCNILN